MKKTYYKEIAICAIVASLLLCCFVKIAFAGGVTDDNNGKLGQILVSTGENHGAKSVGHWTNADFLKGDKGDKGDQGEQGIAGNDGYTPIKGVDYFDGLNGLDGKDGYTPIKGVDYFDGLDGATGDKGDVGEKGETGDDGYTPVKDVDYFDGINGINGKDGKDVDPKEVQRLDTRIDNLDSRVSKLERTQYVLETSFRIVDTKRITLRPFFRYNFGRSLVDTVGLKVDVKLGTSYEEKLIKQINKRLDKIERVLGTAPVIEKVVDENGNVKSISISSEGLTVTNSF